MRAWQGKMLRLNALAGLACVSPGLAVLACSVFLAACSGGVSVGSSSSSPGGGSASSSGGSLPEITIAPASAILLVGAGQLTFSATVTDSPDTAVTWQVAGVTGGDPSVGTITTSGIYSAPSSVPATGSVTVTAVAVADSSRSASAIVTLMAPGIVGPTVPGVLRAASIATGSVTLTWTASADPGGPGIAGYYVYRNGTQIAIVSNGAVYTDSPLTAATAYSYQVAAFDSAAAPNVSALTGPLDVQTLPDTQAPTVPVGLSASNIATGSITLSWSASADLPNPGATGLGGYYVYRNGSRIATITSGATFSDTPLTASTTYSYQVAAFDNAAPANVSALSSALRASTLADTQAPTVPTGLTVTSKTSTAVALAWNASSDLPNPGATGVGGYYIYRNGLQVGTASGTSYTDSGLSATTTYGYRIAAFDKATPANVSAQTAPLSASTPGPLSVTPHNAELTSGQTQQFVTNAPNGTALNWSVDGIAGGNGSVGAVSAVGLYTPPSAGGVHTLTVAGTISSSYSDTATIAVTDLTAIATYHVDLARTGQNLQEYALTPATVQGGSFGKLWSCPLDGAAYAQPLYMASVMIGGGVHNVVLIATMHDSLYAFDADNPNCVTFWQTSFINPGGGVTSSTSANASCNDVLGEYGINGTPVIDLNTQTIYLVTNTTENGTVYQRLHALQLATGSEQPQSPRTIQASVAGNGDGGTSVNFSAGAQNQRTGLALSGGGVLIGWGSHCDDDPWHGWLMRYDATSLAQTAVFNSTPNGFEGGIWMAGAAPALDSSGNLFLSTGNGDFSDTNSNVPALAPNNDFGESFLNLNPYSLSVQDFYTPSNNALWSSEDRDIAAGGLVVIPDGDGPANHPNLLIGTDKQGHIWSIDRNNMSGYVAGADNTVQYLILPGASAYSIHNVPAYWNGMVYVAMDGGPLMALQFTGGLLPARGGIAIAASQSAESYGYTPPSAMISASPAGNAIVWALDNKANGTDDGAHALGPAILRAYDATNLGVTLYSSDQRTADTAGNAAKFTLPVIANGHVYLAGASSMTVYGLAP
jgi:chitodextrinase